MGNDMLRYEELLREYGGKREYASDRYVYTMVVPLVSVIYCRERIGLRASLHNGRAGQADPFHCGIRSTRGRSMVGRIIHLGGCVGEADRA